MTRVVNQSTSEVDIAEMSLNNGDDVVQASNESFWEVGRFMRTVKRVDNGHMLCAQLKALISARAEIEKAYAKQLTTWTRKWNEFLDKGKNEHLPCK